MELWRELIISGLQNEDVEYDTINDKILIDIIENKSYSILQQIKQTLEDEALQDEDCFIKIEEILKVLEENNVFCDRHDFG